MLRFNVISARVSQFVFMAFVASVSLSAGCDVLQSTGADDTLLQAASQLPPFPSPNDFVSAVTNPFFPLTPGAVFDYQSEDETGRVTVTNQAKTILGIAATVVHDEVFVDGQLAEDTYDWYAQDKSGNVWYLGEASCEIENGQCVSTEGSWETGVDGAQAGIIMWADPAAHKGENYRQEFYEGVAEDMAKVLKTGLSVSVPAGNFSDCVETMDWTPLEPGAREHKFYCSGTGLVLETNKRERNELISVTGN